MTEGRQEKPIPEVRKTEDGETIPRRRKAQEREKTANGDIIPKRRKTRRPSRKAGQPQTVTAESGRAADHQEGRPPKDGRKGRRTDGKTAAETTAGRATSPAEPRKDRKPYRVPRNAQRAAESRADGKNGTRGVIHKRQTRKSTILKKTTDPDEVCGKST